MGLEMLVPAEYRIWNLNTPKVPEGVDDAKVRADSASRSRHRDRRRLRSAGRQGLPHRTDGTAGDQRERRRVYRVLREGTEVSWLQRLVKPLLSLATQET